MVLPIVPNIPAPNTATSGSAGASTQTVQPVVAPAAVLITARPVTAAEGTTAGSKGDTLRKRDARKDGARKHQPDDHKQENLHLNLVV